MNDDFTTTEVRIPDDLPGRSDAWLRSEALAHAVAIHKAGAVAGVPPRGTVVELAEEYLAFLKGEARTP
jgi:hypothetical protein